MIRRNTEGTDRGQQQFIVQPSHKIRQGNHQERARKEERMKKGRTFDPRTTQRKVGKTQRRVRQATLTLCQHNSRGQLFQEEEAGT